MLIKKKKKAPKFCSKTCPRINQYKSDLVNEMVTAAKRRLGGGKFAYDNFQVSNYKNLLLPGI